MPSRRSRTQLVRNDCAWQSLQTLLRFALLLIHRQRIGRGMRRGPPGRVDGDGSRLRMVLLIA